MPGGIDFGIGIDGVVLLVRRCLRSLLTWRDPDGRWRNWGLPVAIICAGSAAVLWAPDIVPDQPWASRRLVPLVIRLTRWAPLLPLLRSVVNRYLVRRIIQ